MSTLEERHQAVTAAQARLRSEADRHDKSYAAARQSLDKGHTETMQDLLAEIYRLEGENRLLATLINEENDEAPDPEPPVSATITPLPRRESPA